MKFTFVAESKALRSADHLLVVAPATTFGPRSRALSSLKKLLDGPTADLVMQLGREATVGLLGGSATSLQGKQRVTVGVLPASVSRHASEARAESVRKLTAAAGLRRGKNAALLCLDDAAHELAACNAVGRALPDFTLKSGKQATATLAIACALPDGAFVKVSAKTKDVVQRAREAARFVDMPPTDLNPGAFAAAAKKLLRAVPGVKVTEVVGDALLKKKLGGIHAVGRTALSAPRMLVATANPTKKKHIALVGKGVTYDTGGLHLKGRGAMETMKADMGGAAAVLGAFLALAKHHKKHKLTLVMCLAENAIGPHAYKPDDVLTMHSGKTVEVNNTDAEGRLLLADGCSYAARVLKADTVLDAATLTGAQGVATGQHFGAVVSNDDDVEQALCAAGRSSGDMCWSLPFAPEFFRSEFASPIADMRNSVKNRSNAQVSCAAEFIHWNVDGSGARWGHVDLAYPAFRGNRGTGYGVALLVDAVQRLG
ncbi:MAG: leucyl aminopeptidase family protein [Planctomycetota bacterium]|nr:leucyl aminopeptidase family protein [Planctomycetota bacterium]